MKQESHGRRYSSKEKRDILLYLETHTYKETSKMHKISETTLARWRKSLIQSVSDIKAKIIVGINQYWLDYLNEKIANGKWKNYDEAVLDLLRTYDSINKEQLINISNDEILSKLENFMQNIVEQDPTIKDYVVVSDNEIKYKTPSWPSDDILPLINTWNQLYQEGNPITQFNGIKYVLKISGNQALFTNVGPSQQIEINFDKYNNGLKKSNTLSLEEWEKHNIEKDYICGIEVDFFERSWFFLAHFKKKRYQSFDIIYNFYNSVRKIITPISAKTQNNIPEDK